MMLDPPGDHVGDGGSITGERLPYSETSPVVVG